MSIVRQVKIFQGLNESIEKKINEWLFEKANKIDIIDIKVASGGNGATTIRETYVIIYQENDHI